MSKSEVRLFVLTKAALQPQDVVIDVGAGTGSFSVEASALAYEGTVYAVEKEAEGIELIQKNAATHGVKVKTIQGKAPEALTGLPCCDAFIVGGSGGKLTEILEAGHKLLKPKGRLVVTAIMPESFQTALAWLEKNQDYEPECILLQATRLRKVGSGHMMQALNPIYIIWATKKPQISEEE